MANYSIDDDKPSFEVIHSEIDRLTVLLEQVATTRSDKFGALDDFAAGQAKAAVSALQGAKVLLTCIQDLSPYRRP